MGSLLWEDNMKVASLVTGILSVVLLYIPILSAILGIVAIVTACKSEGGIAGMSVAGLTCGIVGAAINVILTIGTGCTIFMARR